MANAAKPKIPVSNTKVLLHVDTSGMVCDVIDGKPYKLPPFEPVEINKFFATKIIEHIGHLHGIVEVKTLHTGTGIEWDVDEALEHAEKYLTECEKAIVTFYIRQQMEDRVAAGKPALPPTGRALEVILKNKVNLAQQFGLRPVGWTDPGQVTPNSGNESNASGNNEQVTALQAQVAALTKQMKEFMQLLNPEDAPVPEPPPNAQR